MKYVMFASAALVFAASAPAFAGEAEGEHIANPVYAASISTRGSDAEPGFGGPAVRLSAALPQSSRGADAEPVFASVPVQAETMLARK
jgi:hypothetical protein